MSLLSLLSISLATPTYYYALVRCRIWNDLYLRSVQFSFLLANAKLEEKYQIWNAQKNDNVIGNMILNSS